MPELPEVETIAQNLRPTLAGKTVAAAQVLWARTLAIPSPEEFRSRIVGQAITGTERRGKFLLLPLTADTLIIHLRMSGDLRVRPSDIPIAHDRLILTFTDGDSLAFNDPRKFGRVWLTRDSSTVLGNLGPEPLDEAFTSQSFYTRLQKRHRQIKPLLLDQSFLAGVGNIYADESLHLAKLHPLTLSHRLSPAQAETLWRSLRAVLAEGILRHGASIDWVYRGGDFQNYFRVYRRAGGVCPECGATIERIVVGQRGTHFCPVCQSQG